MSECENNFHLHDNARGLYGKKECKSTFRELIARRSDKFWQKYSNLTCTSRLPTWRHFSSFSCYMNCSYISHEIFSLQQLKVIKYVRVHLEGHTMLSKLVHEGKFNSNSRAHEQARCPLTLIPCCPNTKKCVLSSAASFSARKEFPKQL